RTGLVNHDSRARARAHAQRRRRSGFASLRLFAFATIQSFFCGRSSRTLPGTTAAGARPMSPARLNALTDGVVAIVLTIMVLELKFPAQPTVQAVLDVLPLLAAYLLAFVNVAIYWNNHHHMVQSARRVTGAVLWANNALLFWLTLFPLLIRWLF